MCISFNKLEKGEKILNVCRNGFLLICSFKQYEAITGYCKEAKNYCPPGPQGKSLWTSHIHRLNVIQLILIPRSTRGSWPTRTAR